MATIVPSIILSVMYFMYVSHEERESRDVNGRRKVENEERKGDRMAGKAVGEWNGECEVGGRWVWESEAARHSSL